jgi:hypothetical protein
LVASAAALGGRLDPRLANLSDPPIERGQG